VLPHGSGRLHVWLQRWVSAIAWLSTQVESVRRVRLSEGRIARWSSVPVPANGAALRRGVRAAKSPDGINGAAGRQLPDSEVRGVIERCLDKAGVSKGADRELTEAQAAALVVRFWSAAAAAFNRRSPARPATPWLAGARPTGWCCITDSAQPETDPI